MLQCLVVAVRPLEVEELAELLAFEFDAAPEGIPKYCPSLRLNDQMQAVLSTCSSLVTIIDKWDYYSHRSCHLVQFSHFSVKEFLVSERLASSLHDISQYRICLETAHITLTQACLGLLLYLDEHITEESVELDDESPPASYTAEHWAEHITEDSVELEHASPSASYTAEHWAEHTTKHSVEREHESPSASYAAEHWVEHITEESVELKHDSPLASYAAEHWVEHAQFEGVASHVMDGIETLFDPEKPHFVAWMKAPGMYSLDLLGNSLRDSSELPSPLYYSVLCGFYDLIEHLAIKHPQYVNSFGGRYGFPLLAALCQGNIEVAELLLRHGADVNGRESTGQTMLLVALRWLIDHNHILNIVEFLLTHGADVDARDDTFTSSLHLTTGRGHVVTQVVTILLKHKADVNSQDIHGNTPLHKLLESPVFYHNEKSYEDSNRVKLLLEHSAEVNSRRHKDNQTPFFLAIKFGRFRAAQVLLEYGADAVVESINGKSPWPQSSKYDEDGFLDLNEHSIYGKSPWHLLSEYGTYDEDEALDYALLLLKLSAEVPMELNRLNNNNETPLLLAIRSNQFRLAVFLLEHGAEANAENDQGMTPLHIMSENGSIDEDDMLYGGMTEVVIPESRIKDESDMHNLVLLLLKHGAEVNRGDKRNQTPLHLATRRNQFRLAAIFLEHGADANAENKQGMTPMHMLPESRIGFDELEGDALDHALLLFKYGAEVNKWNNDKQTPLHLAIRKHQFRLAATLLEHGADANAEGNRGMTPLHMLAVFHLNDLEGDAGALNHALLLFKYGAEVNRWDNDNQTPLHLTIREHQFRLAATLLEHGADANAEGDRGVTPLHMLAECHFDHLKDSADALNHALLLSRLLFKYGAEVNRWDKDNQTPLHLAIRAHQFRLVAALLEHGADANAEGDHGMTPLHILPQSNRVGEAWGEGDTLHLAPLLLRHGADVNRRDEYNRAPLHLAIQKHRFQLAGIFLEHGADVGAEDNNGKTPLHMLSEFWSDYYKGDFVNHARLLLLHGVGVNRQNKKNKNLSLLGTEPGMGPYEFTEIIIKLSADASVMENIDETSVKQVYKSPIRDSCGSRDFALYFANGFTEIFPWCGVDLDVKVERTPTSLQSGSGPIQIAALLHYYGANHNIGKNEGESSIYQEIKGEYYIQIGARITQRLTKV